MTTLGGNVPTLDPDWAKKLVDVITIKCTTCGHILANHHWDIIKEAVTGKSVKRWCNEASGCTCKQFTEAKDGQA